MIPGLVLVPSCDNCVPGGSSPYYLPLFILAAAGLILGVGVLLLTRGAPKKARVYGIVAAFCLGIGLPAAIALSHYSVTAEGAICGGALSASLERGVPTDSALDSTQSACKERGQTVIHYAVTSGAAALLLGAMMTMASAISMRSGNRGSERKDELAHTG